MYSEVYRKPQVLNFLFWPYLRASYLCALKPTGSELTLKIHWAGLQARQSEWRDSLVTCA